MVIQIFWLLLLGTLGDAISKVVLLKYLRHHIYFFLHACKFRMEYFVTIRAFLPFSSLFPFGSGGIDEGFCVPFLLQMCMRFLFLFIFRFLIFVASIMHSEWMCTWAFDCAHVDELGFLLCHGFDKVLKRKHLPRGSRGESDRMECGYKYKEFRTNLGENGETICFSSFDLSTPQDLSCDNKSLNFVKKSWILSNIFGSNVSSSTSNMCPLISLCFLKRPSKVVQASLGVLQKDM
jgi:hypothetical protein